MSDSFTPMSLLGHRRVRFYRRQFHSPLHGRNPDCRVVNLDVLTYAGKSGKPAGGRKQSSLPFYQGDISMAHGRSSPRGGKVDAIVHFAAESHVDRSITGPEIFVRTNVLGTQILLEKVVNTGSRERCPIFRFLQVSTTRFMVFSAKPAILPKKPLWRKFSLFGKQGGSGSSCAGLPRNLRFPTSQHTLL